MIYNQQLNDFKIIVIKKHRLIKIIIYRYFIFLSLNHVYIIIIFVFSYYFVDHFNQYFNVMVDSNQSFFKGDSFVDKPGIYYIRYCVITSLVLNINIASRAVNIRYKMMMPSSQHLILALLPRGLENCLFLRNQVKEKRLLKRTLRRHSPLLS